MSFFDDLFGNLLQDQRGLNAVGTGLEVGGQIVGGLNHIQYGQQTQAAAEYQAAQLRQNAGQAQASAQRTAFDVDRQSQYITSSALAHAAASGGGASDPTVINLIARNAGEMAYHKSIALYQGDDKARVLNMQADAKEYEGKTAAANATTAGMAQGLGAVASLLKGSTRDASLLQRFGAGGPEKTSSSTLFGS